MAKVRQPVSNVMTDERFISDPDLWSCWPFCPVKRRGGTIDTKDMGVLLYTKEHVDAVAGKGQFVIYHGYIFAWPKTPADHNVSNAVRTSR